MISIMNIPSPFHLVHGAFRVTFRLAAGDSVFRLGDAARGPFYVATGNVQLLRHTEAGQRIVLHRAGEGETLAEACLFSDNYHCDCIAATESVLIRFDKQHLLDRLQADGTFARELLQRFAGQVQGYRRRLEVLAIKSAEQRVCVALEEFGQQGSVMAFAAMIGLSHEATYRALSRLVKRGQVRRIARGQYRPVGALDMPVGRISKDLA
jgi:CRP-like cAMP-binding protein